MKKSTMIHLVEELEKLPRTPQIAEMIHEAKAGEYHDFKNKKYVCGKVESYNRLMALGHKELADRIKNGEFDEECDESDIAAMKEFAPKELHNVLGLDSEAQPQKLNVPEDTIAKWLEHQRAQASHQIIMAHQSTKSPEQWSIALTQLEMFATHMLATIYTNQVKNGVPLKDLLDQHKRLLTDELNFISENMVSIPPQGASRA